MEESILPGKDKGSQVTYNTTGGLQYQREVGRYAKVFDEIPESRR
jgi:hypothetical protein